MSGDDRDAFLRRFAARLGLPSDAPAEEFERVISERLGFAGWDLDWAFHWWMGTTAKSPDEPVRVVQEEPARPETARSLGRKARPRPKPKGGP